MTIGIYALVFTGTDLIYVGQSVNIEKRYKEHLYSLNRGASNKKLQHAYKSYGIPELFVLEECSSDLLDTLEVSYIKSFNSVEAGLNEWDGPVEVCRGAKHPNSKYTEEQILQVVRMLGSSDCLTFKEISGITGVTVDSIENVSCGKAWAHLKDKFPTEYEAMCANKIRRKSNSSAKGRGIVYPPIISPEGVEYLITNVTEFSKIHSLNMSHMCGVLNGVRKSHKGWRLKCNTE